MRYLWSILLCLVAGAAHAASPTGRLEPVQATLLAETTSVTPGQTLWTDLHLEIAPGWHVYWRNPGDSGLPTEIAWTLPAGFAAGDIAWPIPERFVVGTIGNYGYAGTADLLVPINVAADATAGATTHIAAHATWLVCSDICIPGETELSLDLPVAAGPVAADPAIAAKFAAMREKLPQTVPVAARFSQTAGEYRLFVPAQVAAGLRNPQIAFFPSQQSLIDAAAEPRQRTVAGGFELSLARIGGPAAKSPVTLDGVLAVRGENGPVRGYTLAVPQGPAAAGAVESDGAAGWWQAALFAFLGGLLLNLMPCVFPVLSLKILGIAEAAHRAQERIHALAYGAGAIVSFAVLGGVLLALRSGGAAIGWGFQLQSPVVVALLAYLLFAMGLSLSGVAEFGASLAGTGSRFVRHHGLAAAFATGVLATIVATPCTAPFMGAALGAALVAPVPVAVAIFTALGCGLAAPVVVASWLPGLARRVPRPGPWMIWFKQILAFPLYATVAWLVWVLGQEIGPAEMFAALLGLVAVAFAVWAYGRTRLLGKSGRLIGSGLGAAAVAIVLVIAATLSPAATPAVSSAARNGLGYEPFSATRLAGLEAEHRSVFVNLTAAWCITCLVNERTALDSAAIRDAFSRHGVVALKGDWTRQDPEITSLLQKFGRSGVPLYVLYDRNGAPTVLPQLLTEAAVLDALDKIAKG